MSKNKTINQLLINIVLAGLLSGTLPMSLPLRGQVQKPAELKKLRMEVAQEVKHIKKVVDSLKRAKIIIPSVIAVVGGAVLAFAAMVATVAVVVILKASPLKKLLKQQKKLEKEIYKNKDLYLIKDIRDHIKWIADLIEEKRKIDFEIIKGARVGAELKKKGFRKKVAASVAILSIIAAIVTAIVAPLTTFAAFKVLSKESVKRASQGVIQFEQIEKKYPYILTVQQKQIVASFKNLYKDPTARGIIQGLRLKDALIAAVDAAMQERHALVAALGGQKKARKIITRYLKLRWQENMFQKALTEDAKFIKSFVGTKKKIAKLEARYPELKAALKNAVQMYTTQANAILEELKNEVIKAAEAKEAKKIKVPLQPVVPL